MSLSHGVVSAQKAKTFHRNLKTRSFLSYADENRKVGRFNDVTIQLENQNLPAHKMILSCYSKYFEEIFAAEMNKTCQSTIEINECDSIAVKLIIDYFYAENIVIDTDNVLNVLAAADYMQVDDVKGFCLEFLESNLTIENCLQIISSFHFYLPEASLKQTYQFMSKHLNEISLETKFKSLSNHDLNLIIARLDENMVKESSKYSAIINWVKHDVKIRKADLTALFKSIDLFRVEYEFLEDVIAAEPLLKENVACLNAIMECHVSRGKEIGLRSNNSKILCIGGTERGLVVEVHNITGNPNSVYPPLPLNVSKHGGLFVNHSVFSIGGISRSKRSRTKRVFQLNVRESELKWREVASMDESRSDFGAAVFKERLIIAGGFRNNSITDSVELYEMKMNKWRSLSSLNSSRSSNALVVCHDCVFAVGGYNRGETLSSVERLNNLDQNWEIVAPMEIPRYNLAAVNCEGVLYAIGGSSARGIEKSVEKYNRNENRWSSVIASMNIERFGHSACCLHGKIIVVGGRNATGNLVREIDCYDPVNDRWKIVGNADYDFEWHALIVI